MRQFLSRRRKRRSVRKVNKCDMSLNMTTTLVSIAPWSKYLMQRCRYTHRTSTKLISIDHTEGKREALHHISHEWCHTKSECNHASDWNQNSLSWQLFQYETIWGNWHISFGRPKGKQYQLQQLRSHDLRFPFFSRHNVLCWSQVERFFEIYMSTSKQTPIANHFYQKKYFTLCNRKWSGVFKELVTDVFPCKMYN